MLDVTNFETLYLFFFRNVRMRESKIAHALISSSYNVAWYIIIIVIIIAYQSLIGQRPPPPFSTCFYPILIWSIVVISLIPKRYTINNTQQEVLFAVLLQVVLESQSRKYKVSFKFLADNLNFVTTLYNYLIYV